jgi:hypothetical protein
LETKITRLSKGQVQALAEEYPSEQVELSATTATFAGAADEVLALLQERAAALPEDSAVRAGLEGAARKVEALTPGGAQGVLVAPEPETEPEVKEKPAKAETAPKAENKAVLRLLAGIEDGTVAHLLAAEELTPGGLAKKLDVESAVVGKILNGKRTPRPTSAPDSIAGKVAAWYVAASKRAAKKAS